MCLWSIGRSTGSWLVMGWPLSCVWRLADCRLKWQNWLGRSSFIRPTQAYSQGSRKILKGKIEWKCAGPLAKHCFHCILLVKMNVTKYQLGQMGKQTLLLGRYCGKYCKGEWISRRGEDCVSFSDLLHSICIFSMYVSYVFSRCVHICK